MDMSEEIVVVRYTSVDSKDIWLTELMLLNQKVIFHMLNHKYWTRLDMV